MRELSPLWRSGGLVAVAMVSSAFADLEVSVTLNGVDDADLAAELRKLSSVAADKNSYTAIAPLRRAVESDAQLMQRALLSKGYYAATVSPSLDRTGLEVAVVFDIVPGERFEISDYRIDYLDEQSSERPLSLDMIGIETKGVPTGDRLKEIGSQIVSYLWDNGYPSAALSRREVLADFGATRAEAVYHVTTGPLAHYGEIRVSGNDRTEASHIKAYFKPEAGDTYSRSEIDSYRSALAGTGLFREISIQPASPEADGRTDLLVEVTERPPRTIGAGVSFSTDVGVGVTAEWENRNLFGSGERITAELDVSAPTQVFNLGYEKPLPRLPGSWSSSFSVENEETDAYEAQTVTVGTGLNKYFQNRIWEVGGGIRYTFSDITDFSDPDDPEGVDETAQTISLPLYVSYNTENDPLNPTSGHRARLAVAPYFGDLQFTRTELLGASRIGFGRDKKYLVAGRARLGASIGASGTDLPATERFYAGGGGSVRGYAYQEAGPIDRETGNPTGGASVAEVNLEARYRFRENMQLAVFTDGGTVFESETPDFSGEFLVGAGIGFRYLTPIGPVRLDIATPLDKREIRGLRENDDGVLEEQTIFKDDPIQVYIALGQPF